MSLKAFHVVFVTLSTVMATGFGVWAIQESARDGLGSPLAVGIVSLVGAVGLIIYGVWFLRKLKRFSWL